MSDVEFTAAPPLDENLSTAELAAQIHTNLNAGRDQKGFLESSIDLVTKGIPATLIAAGNELANIPAAFGNLIEGNNSYKLTSNYDAIRSYDSDLGKYYEDHKLGIDSAGFLASQFVPGMAGVKGLRAGQGALRAAASEGKFGATFAEAFALKEPLHEKYLAQAIREIGDTGNVFKLSESNLLRSFAAGVGQEALEGAAWTAAVNATMFKSPILDHRDASDLMMDVVTGAWLGGAIGGALRGVGAAWKVKGAVLESEQAVLPWTIKGLGGESTAGGLSASDKILLKLQQLDAIPEVPHDFKYYERAGRTAQATKERLQNEIRALTGEFAKGDQEVAHIATRTMEGNLFESNLANLIESSHISRVTKVSAIEKEAEGIFKQMQKFMPGAEESFAKYRTTFVNTLSGKVVDEPKLLTLADYGNVSVKRDTVTAGKLKYAQKEIADVSGMEPLQAEARYTWAEKTFKAKDPNAVIVIGEGDIPMMKAALEKGHVNVNIGTREVRTLGDLQDAIITRQGEIAADLVKKGKSLDEAARIVNVHPDALSGGLDKTTPELWNYRKWVRDTFTSKLDRDPWSLPSHYKIITKKGGAVDSVTGHVLEGMTIVAQKQKLYHERARAIVSETIGEILPSAAGTHSKAIGTEAGSTFLRAEGGAYGTLSSFYAYVGQRVSNIVKAKQNATRELLDSNLHKLANDTNAAVEWSALNETLRNKVQGYKLSEDGTSLVLMSGKEVVDTVPIKSELVQKIAADHINLNGTRRAQLGKMHANNGYPDKIDPAVFYPIPRDPKDTPFFAFVVDNTINGRGHSKMIYAKDGETLEAMRNEIMNDPTLRDRGIKVLTRGESEEYYKSIGQYEFERSLSDNYINNALARKGKSASFIPLTDPQRIAEDTLNWHLKRDAGLVRTAVEHHYADEFATLRTYAEGPLSASKSKFGNVNPTAYAENTVDNPAANLIKLALNISKADEYPVWSPANRFLDSVFSKLYDKVTTTFSAATSTKHLKEVEAALKEYGYQDVVMTPALYEATNGKIPRGKLSELVSNANSLISMLALRTDPFNALNNAVGHAVLLGPEIQYIRNNILKGNESAVGELAALMKVAVPGTGGKSAIDAPAKLVANRISKFHTDEAGREWMRQHGFITDVSTQYHQSVDNIAQSLAKGDTGKMQAAMDGIKKLGAGAEKWSGNRLAEELNRYVAAGVMKDITDIAVKHGAMDAGTQLSFINTFVNRTQGNYLASQRPGLFQGPLGQAIGLFQTYQFNLLQQVFRYIGEGEKKTVMLMGGLQAGIYGLNGLPAFNAINTHIIGSAGGNKEHLTGYDAVMSGAGKEAGEWLLYGGLSNGLSLFHPDLKSNIYTRGDINPRQITLVPLDPSKTPIYQATERFLSNTYEGFTQVKAGANVWDTFLRGVEHNGMSRPLAGLSLVLEGLGRPDNAVISTSQQGRIIASHDLWSLQSLMRLGGAKPLDEAIVSDQLHRVNAWRAADIEKRKQLGEGIKKTLLSGKAPTPEQINSFAYEYARSGGKQDGFAQFMAQQYTQVQKSKAEELRTAIGNPYSHSMQYIMQGYTE